MAKHETSSSSIESPQIQPEQVAEVRSRRRRITDLTPEEAAAEAAALRPALKEADRLATPLLRL